MSGLDQNVYTKANARLIAAAPEMLGALQNAVVDCEEVINSGCPREALNVTVNAMQQAIQKATGGTLK